MVNITTTASRTVNNASIIDVQVNLNDIAMSVKQIDINTDGPLQFSGHPMFMEDAEVFTFTVRAGATAALGYTLINAIKSYNIAPLRIAGNEAWSFTITNDSGAVRTFTIDFVK